jgi:hypothetical protein
VAPVSPLAVRIEEKRFPAVGEAGDRLVLENLAFEVPAFGGSVRLRQAAPARGGGSP